MAKGKNGIDCFLVVNLQFPEATVIFIIKQTLNGEYGLSAGNSMSNICASIKEVTPLQLSWAGLTVHPFKLTFL